MGASSGFLSFVDREAIPAFASPQAYRFSLAASLLAVAAGMGPVFATFRHTIVTFSRRGARRTRSLWHRLFLDVILLAVAAVAYRELMWQSTRLAPDETVAADPILFFVPVVFLLGAGLLLLRIYPFLLAGLRWISGTVPRRGLAACPPPPDAKRGAVLSPAAPPHPDPLPRHLQRLQRPNPLAELR